MGEYYSIHVSDDTRETVERAIKSFNDQIKVKKRTSDTIIFESGEVAASALSVMTGIDAYHYKDVINIAHKELARIATSHANASPVPAINGQPAKRYMAEVDLDDSNAAPVTEAKTAIEKTGLRLYNGDVPSLAVVFFDVADPQQLAALTLPKGWALRKLSAPAP